MKSEKIAKYGLLIALAFIFSYIESLIPIPFPVPGIKLGLANLVVIIAIYGIGVKEAFVLSMVRILLVGHGGDVGNQSVQRKQPFKSDTRYEIQDRRYSVLCRFT